MAKELSEEAAELRALIREAHEAMKGIRDAIRDADKRIESVSPAVSETINDAVEKGLDAYKETLEKAIERSTQAVYDRFDLIAAIVLGEDYHSKQSGRPSVAELMRRHLNAICTCARRRNEPHGPTCPVRQIVGEP